MLSHDLIYIGFWWFVILAIGIVSVPISSLLFKGFTDIGYGFSKTLGFLFITYLVFLLGIFKLVPFETTFLCTYIAVLFLVNLLVFLKFRKQIVARVRNSLRVIIFQEILFTVGLIFWSVVRAHQPDINGLEKFMDFGFINSILKSEYLPPTDMWFSGKTINYYWFGHLLVAVATKLSGIPSAVTYNLMLATILGVSLTAAFSISSTLIKSLKKSVNKKAIFAAGIISALVLTFAGNFHTPLYILKEGRNKYWYPDATRFIGYNPDINDKTIHEFPIYSFVVSDLHAHLINLPIVLLYLALLWTLVKKISKDTFPLRQSLVLGFFLGIIFMTNTWDFANYLLVTSTVIGIVGIGKYGFKYKTLEYLAKIVILILVISILTALPFILNFDSLAQGIKFVQIRTPFWQLAVLWGFPAIFSIIFLNLLIKYKKEIKLADYFVLGLLTSSWILITIPEIIFVKDIYIASHQRANTMFKLTYQAFVMFYLSSGYIAVRTFTLVKKSIFKSILFLFFLALFASVLWYPSIATNSYYNNLKIYKGLSGETWLKEKYPDEYKAILWLRENVKNQATILEAPGDSYTEYNVISSYTGLPTVSGWFVHEWLWRGSSEAPQKRVSDIDQTYTSEDINSTLKLLKKYKVEYLILGTFERQKYQNINEEKFKKIGKIVFSSGDTTIYKFTQ